MHERTKTHTRMELKMVKYTPLIPILIFPMFLRESENIYIYIYIYITLEGESLCE